MLTLCHVLGIPWFINPHRAYHMAGGSDNIEVNFQSAVKAIKEVNKIGWRIVWWSKISEEETYEHRLKGFFNPFLN